MTRLAAVALVAVVVTTAHTRGSFPHAAADVWTVPPPAAPPSQQISRKAERVRARVDVAFRRVQQGLASYYARHFEGRLTASGVPFDNEAMFAAHPNLPFGTLVRVTNLGNGQSVNVRVVDRGPARGPRSEGVVIDLSRAAAEALGFVEAGRTKVRVERIASNLTPAGVRQTEAAAGR